MYIRSLSIVGVVLFSTGNADAAPVFESAPVVVIDGDSSYAYGIVASDLTGEVAITADVLPAWLTLSSAPGWTSSTVAGGQGEVGFIDGTGTNARFKNMYGVAVAPNGDLFVADTHNHAIRHIDAQTRVVTTVGGNGEKGHADGLGAAARFHFPQGIAVDAEGNVFVADAFNHCVRRIEKDSWQVTTIAGNPTTSGAVDGVADGALFTFPKGIAVDANDQVWVADSGNHSIRRIAENGAVTTVAGLSGSSGNRDGTGAEALFNSPRGMAFGAGGTLFIADKDNHQIRTLDPDTARVTTVAGTGSPGKVDGVGRDAAFWHPFDVVADATGNLYVVDSSNHQVRRIDAEDSQVTTISGTGWPGFSEGVGPRAQFYVPRAISMAGETLIVSDRTNGTLRALVPTQAQLLGTAGPDELGGHAVQLRATGTAESSPQSFTIEVQRLNQRPELEGSPGFIATVGSPYSFVPSASDGDGDELAFSVFMLPAWASFDATTGEVSGVPTAEDVGMYVHIAVTADDQTGADNATRTLAPFAIRVDPAPDDGTELPELYDQPSALRDEVRPERQPGGCSSAGGSGAAAVWLGLLFCLLARRRRDRSRR